MRVRKTTEQFISEAQHIHGNKYIYDKSIYLKANAKITITCKIHGSFITTPIVHLSGSNCPKCVNFGRKTAKQFIKEAKKIHNNKYNYDKIVYFNTKTKIKIICLSHGEFLQSPEAHLSGHGCRKCSIENAAQRYAKSLDQFIIDAKKVHGNKYDYSLVNYINSGIKIKIICPVHKEFEQIPDNHLAGKGCKKCSHTFSKSENLWLDTLNIKPENRQYLIKINSKKYVVDGYDPLTNTIYEFYGDLWHGNPKIHKPNDINYANKYSFKQLYDETMQREIELKEAGYNLITIWENDFKK